MIEQTPFPIPEKIGFPDTDEFKDSILNACRWLIDVAMVKTRELTVESNQYEFSYTDWRGAIRGEYDVATKRWDFFCPMWHSGQALKGLSLAYLVFKEQWLLDGAKEVAGFLTRNCIADRDDPNFGAMYAYEGIEGINCSAVMETVDGLFHLAKICPEDNYRDIAINVLDRLHKNSYIQGEGLFKPLLLGRRADDKLGPRPLIDDAVYHRAFKITGEKKYLDCFIEAADKLLNEEIPDGNWATIKPSRLKRGIHPRQAYWWGRPMLMAYEATGDKKYLDCAIRCADWYTRALRKDGSMFRMTHLDFSTDGFGHATSGVACAIINWHDLTLATGTTRYLSFMQKALEFHLLAQFKNPADENLKGAILEKVLPPDGTDNSPYYLRDLGTIFYVQAGAMLLKNLPELFKGEKPAASTVERSDPAAVEWQKRAPLLRQKLLESFAVPDDRGPLDVQWHGEIKTDFGTIKKVTYRAEENSRVTANLYLPAGDGPFPGLVLPNGHGSSKSSPGTQFGAQMYAALGIAVLTLDTIGEEERSIVGQMGTREHDLYEKGSAAVDFQVEEMKRLVGGKIILDAIRGLDLLESLDEIDSTRLACAGHSMGGTTASLMASIDTRISCAVISGWAHMGIFAFVGKPCSALLYKEVKKLMTIQELIALMAPHVQVFFLNGDQDDIDWEDGLAFTHVLPGELRRAAPILDLTHSEGNMRAKLFRGGHRNFNYSREALLFLIDKLGLGEKTRAIVKNAAAIGFGDWAKKYNLELEPYTAQKINHAGLITADLGVVPFDRNELACFPDKLPGDEQYTFQGWVDHCLSRA